MDDELDALREMENEAGGGKTNVKQSLSKEPNADPMATDAGDKEGSKKNDEEAAILAADHLELLGGFDDEARFDNPDGDEQNAGLDRDGRPLKVYKKKGQKRTTRKANMRPVRAKRPTTKDMDEPGSEEEEDVPAPKKQQQQQQQQPEDEENSAPLHSGSDSAASDDDYNDDDEDELAQDMPPIAKKKATTIRKQAAKANTTTITATKEKSEGTIKKAARKVNELAHANFRRLKLRNNGAKGGPGYNSRFRRRR